MLTWEDRWKLIEDHVTQTMEYEDVPQTWLEKLLGKPKERLTVYFSLTYEHPELGIEFKDERGRDMLGYPYQTEESLARAISISKRVLLQQLPTPLAIAIVKTLKEEGRWKPSYAQPDNGCYNLLDTVTSITWSVKVENCYQGLDSRMSLHYSIRDPKGLDEKDQDFVGGQLLAFFTKAKANKAEAEYERSRANLISAYEGK